MLDWIRYKGITEGKIPITNEIYENEILTGMLPMNDILYIQIEKYFSSLRMKRMRS